MRPWQLDARTVLRPLAREHAAAFHALLTANRVHLDRWLRWSSLVQTEADAAGFIAEFVAREERGDGFHLGIWAEGALAGGIVCWYIHRQNRNAEIGYWLGEAYLGYGLATRGASEALRHLFEVEGLHRVEMQCAVDNTDSRAIPERLGFRMEGIRRNSHWITDRFRDHAIYGLLAPEWRQRAGRP
jgi:ribosomal-protein-serine acetyltransferase